MPLLGKTEKLAACQQAFFLGKSRQDASRLLRRDGYGQSLPSFGAPAFDDKATVLGRHADEKTVGPFAGGIARLKGSFHGV